MIEVTSKSNFNNIRGYLESIQKPADLFNHLDQYGRMGVSALEHATPVETGETASSWDYKVVDEGRWIGIEWFNTNEEDGIPVAILIQYDHATGTGGWVEGVDYINPAMRPVFDLIISEIREKVKP